MHAAFSRMATPMQKSVLGLLVESTAQAEQLRATLDQITDEATAKQIIGMFVDKDVVQRMRKCAVPETTLGPRTANFESMAQSDQSRCGELMSQIATKIAGILYPQDPGALLQHMTKKNSHFKNFVLPDLESSFEDDDDEIEYDEKEDAGYAAFAEHPVICAVRNAVRKLKARDSQRMQHLSLLSTVYPMKWLVPFFRGVAGKKALVASKKHARVHTPGGKAEPVVHRRPGRRYGVKEKFLAEWCAAALLLRVLHGLPTPTIACALHRFLSIAYCHCLLPLPARFTKDENVTADPSERAAERGTSRARVLCRGQGYKAYLAQAAAEGVPAYSSTHFYDRQEQVCHAFPPRAAPRVCCAVLLAPRRAASVLPACAPYGLSAPLLRRSQ